MKKVLIKLYLFFRKNKQKQRIFKKAKLFLEKGVYSFSPDKNEIKKTTTKLNFFKICLPNYFFLLKEKNKFNLENEEKLERIIYSGGMSKDVFYVGDKVLGFYFKKDFYNKSKEAFINYYHLFRYPCVGGGKI